MLCGGDRSAPPGPSSSGDGGDAALRSPECRAHGDGGVEFNEDEDLRKCHIPVFVAASCRASEVAVGDERHGEEVLPQLEEVAAAGRSTCAPEDAGLRAGRRLCRGCTASGPLLLC
ncbi:beta-1,3-galactosyltransferase 5 isoform X2 [Camelus bactrianus]|uniref:Beta-1,3-galactosyltransferase 5 isoform X2 n=2 Tax=Camelus bactrianus TaxID=9837 RepID=A0AC58PGE2_CAMBA